MAKHKVSVIMNQHREQPDVLSREIKAYLNQEDCDVQLIVSTRIGDPNIPLLSQKFPQVELAILPEIPELAHGKKSPRGTFLQLNNAIPLVKGDWFVFASADDFVYHNKLKLEIEQCIAEGKEVCYSAYNYANPQGKIIHTQPFHDYDYEKHKVGNFVSDVSPISRRLFDKYLPFRTELNNYGYWDLWLRIYEGEGNVFTYNPIPTWSYVRNSTAMHIIRRNDPEEQRRTLKDRNRMLALHGIGIKQQTKRVVNLCADDWANFVYDNTGALKTLGFDVVGLKLRAHDFNYPQQLPVSTLIKMKEAIKRADFVQLFFNKGLYNSLAQDLKDKKIIIWYASSDFRAHKESYLKTFNPVVYKSVVALGEFWGIGAKDEVFMIGAVNTNKLIPSNYIPQKPFKAAHYPSNPIVKGTETINWLMGKIPEIQYTTSNDRVPYDEQIKRILACDIYIELFNPTINGQKYGSFGITALEAAALGKVVVTQNLSKEVYEQTYGPSPLIYCVDEKDFILKLRKLSYMTPAELHTLQRDTREWVVDHHSYFETGARLAQKVLC